MKLEERITLKDELQNNGHGLSKISAVCSRDISDGHFA